MSDRAPTRRSEAAFTLLELVIVLIIIAILSAGAIYVMNGAKQSARARAMTSVGAEVAKATSTFNRMNPPIQSDRLVAGATWTSTQSEAAGGLYSTTGDRLLEPWPTNPYTGAPVVQRAAACPATAQPGAVAVCRVAGSPASLRVRAWARDRSGAAYVVFDQRLA